MAALTAGEKDAVEEQLVVRQRIVVVVEALAEETPSYSFAAVDLDASFAVAAVDPGIVLVVAAVAAGVN